MVLVPPPCWGAAPQRRPPKLWHSHPADLFHQQRPWKLVLSNFPAISYETHFSKTCTVSLAKKLEPSRALVHTFRMQVVPVVYSVNALTFVLLQH